MKIRGVLRVLKIGIIRLLAPDVNGSISPAVDMTEMAKNQIKKNEKIKPKLKIYGYGNKERKQRKKRGKILQARGNLAGIFIKRGQVSDKETRGGKERSQ